MVTSFGCRSDGRGAPQSPNRRRKDGRGCNGGGCDGDRCRGCVDPGRDGDVELRKGGYWFVSLCAGVGSGGGGVGGSAGVEGADSVVSGSGGGVGSGGGDSDRGGGVGGS